MPRSRSQGQTERSCQKKYSFRYQSPSTYHSKLMAKVKIFKKQVKCKGQGHKVKNFGNNRKGLSQGILMSNIKVLVLTIQKLWPRLKFLKSTSNTKVTVTSSKMLVPTERSCHKEYSCQILKLYLLRCNSYSQC